MAMSLLLRALTQVRAACEPSYRRLDLYFEYTVSPPLRTFGAVFGILISFVVLAQAVAEMALPSPDDILDWSGTEDALGLGAAVVFLAISSNAKRVFAAAFLATVASAVSVGITGFQGGELPNWLSLVRVLLIAASFVLQAVVGSGDEDVRPLDIGPKAARRLLRSKFVWLVCLEFAVLSIGSLWLTFYLLLVHG